MARQLRIQYPGAIYHVMSRGDRREAIFADDQDRLLFLKTLGQACAKTDWQVHAFCLMGNHFHLVLETPQANLVAGMQWFLGTYTSRFNRRHKLFGHLFSGRYKSLIVDGSENGYLRSVCDYVHLNPVRAKLLTPQQRLKEYRWSSYPEYLKAAPKRPLWLRVDRLWGEMRIPKDSEAGRRQFELNMEQRREQETPQPWKGLRRGWCFGDESFRKELLAQVHEQAAAFPFGAERQESAEEKAHRLVAEELKKLGWGEKDLPEHRKGDPKKVKMARQLRQETTLTLAWIAQRLHMGTGTYLANRLYHLADR